MRVGANEKFAAFFLSRCRLRADVPADVEIDRGIRVAQRMAIDLGRWPEWLGTLTADAFQEPGLVLYTTSPLATPKCSMPSMTVSRRPYRTSSMP